jgi:hypothetical protein
MIRHNIRLRSESNLAARSLLYKHLTSMRSKKQFSDQTQGLKIKKMNWSINFGSRWQFVEILNQLNDVIHLFFFHLIIKRKPDDAV